LFLPKLRVMNIQLMLLCQPFWRKNNGFLYSHYSLPVPSTYIDISTVPFPTVTVPVRTWYRSGVTLRLERTGKKIKDQEA
jgi:hypothetical protein